MHKYGTIDKSKDEFGDRMKAYERVYTNPRVSVDEVLCVRIDGKGFSKFTKGFKKPFDDTISHAMDLVASRLLRETHASIAYTQSDEITLIYTAGENAHEHIFGGKVSKVNSILASMAAAHFNAILHEEVAIMNKLAFFDCRAFAVPNLVEASNVLLWRVQDARKNSISALFRWTAGHRTMDGLDQLQMKEYLLKMHNVDWNDLSNRYKYGAYIKPVVHETYLSEEERMKIPADKRPEAFMKVKRTKIEEVDVGYFGDLSLEERVEFMK